MPTFKHSGDLGDIIFALPAVRALGGGTLYLDPQGGATEPAVIESTHPRKHTRLTPERIDAIRPLLLAQDYIHDVRPWAGEPIDHNLDLFRRQIKAANLADAHLAAFGLPHSERDRPWLTIADPIVIDGKPIIINRTVRNTGNHGFWESALELVKDRCIFVGLPKEHEIFNYTFECEIPYHPTPTLIDLSRVIAGARQFLGNASLSHAIAEAMKKPLVIEMARICNVRIAREGAEYV